MSEYSPATHRLIHISDPHLLGGPELLYGQVPSEMNLRGTMARLAGANTGAQAIIFTGDLADVGDPEAYRKLRSIVEPAAQEMGAQVIWAMGNHDDRASFRSELLGEAADDSPIDMVYTIDGLRIIVLDTSVPGRHYGLLEDSQLEWLAAELSTEAWNGTILAMHHPPIPCVLEVAASVELRQQRKLADALMNSDVRAILGGHLHYSTSGTFVGIPVSVAAATCYTQDLVTMSPMNAGQAFNLVHVYDETILHSVVPLGR